MAASTAADRVFNFSAGPAVLPVPVLEQIRDEILALPGVGSSILEISHRSPKFDQILKETEDRLVQLLGIPAGYSILFLQGGSRLQFSMVPQNLLGADQTAEYLVSGSWGKHALAEAKKVGATHTLWNGSESNFNQLPDLSTLEHVSNPAYVHITSNETIQGVQFHEDPDFGGIPLVCDASSDFLSRPVDIERYGLIYACAQKNAGPAGVTVVIIRNDLLERASDDLPGYLIYRNHADANSCYNTPPTFAVYVVGLVAKWLQDEIGGLEKMAQLNQSKAAILYRVIDSLPDFYRGHALPEYRSLMNVTFRLPTEELEAEFLSAAKFHGLTDLKGHRSVGGIRASIYNAMPPEGVESLADFMTAFAKQHA